MWSTSGLSPRSPFSLIYINDLPNISGVLHFYLFADDTNICGCSINNLGTVINKELKFIYQLSLIMNKTNFLVFYPSNKPVKDPLLQSYLSSFIYAIKYRDLRIIHI